MQKLTVHLFLKLVHCTHCMYVATSKKKNKQANHEKQTNRKYLDFWL